MRKNIPETFQIAIANKVRRAPIIDPIFLRFRIQNPSEIGSRTLSKRLSKNMRKNKIEHIRKLLLLGGARVSHDKVCSRPEPSRHSKTAQDPSKRPTKPPRDPQEASKMPPRRPKKFPGVPQSVPSFQEIPKTPQEVPKTDSYAYQKFQEGPKTAPRRAKRFQRLPQDTPRRAQEGRRGTKTLQKCPQDALRVRVGVQERRLFGYFLNAFRK